MAKYKTKRGTALVQQWEERDKLIREAYALREKAHPLYSKFTKLIKLSWNEEVKMNLHCEGDYVITVGTSWSVEALICQAEASNLYKKAEAKIQEGNLLFLKAIKEKYGDVEVLWHRKKNRYRQCIICGIREHYGHD